MSEKAKSSAAEEKPSIVCSFTFKDSRKTFTLDVLDLTFEEKAIIEDIFDEPFEMLRQRGWIGFSSKGAIALAFIARRRREPDYAYDRAAADLRKMEAAAEEGGDRPTDRSKENGSRS